MEYDNSICKYCKYRNSWDCSEGCYPTKGCESWSLDDYALTDEQTKRIKNALMLTIDFSDFSIESEWR